VKAQREEAAAARARDDQGLPPPNGFEATAHEWVDTVYRAKVSEGHAARTLIRFEKDAFPYIGRTPFADVTAPILLEALRRVESRGAIETTHRLKDACGQVFLYGIATGRCERDHAAALRDALKPVRMKHLPPSPVRMASASCCVRSTDTPAFLHSRRPSTNE
jgi:hypothetical protein